MITGGTVKKVSAERLSEQVGLQVGMDMNIQIKEAKFEKTKATIKYSYEINYKPNLALMIIEGEIYFEDSEKEVKAWKEMWEKKNMLPEATATDLLTALTYTCSAIGTLLAFAINVNAPINVPRPRISQAPPEAKPAA